MRKAKRKRENTLILLASAGISLRKRFAFLLSPKNDSKRFPTIFPACVTQDDSANFFCSAGGIDFSSSSEQGNLKHSVSSETYWISKNAFHFISLLLRKSIAFYGYECINYDSIVCLLCPSRLSLWLDNEINRLSSQPQSELPFLTLTQSRFVSLKIAETLNFSTGLLGNSLMRVSFELRKKSLWNPHFSHLSSMFSLPDLRLSLKCPHFAQLNSLMFSALSVCSWITV